MTMTAWDFGTLESGRVLPVVGSMTSVWFQVLRALIRPPAKPNRSNGAWMFTDSRSSVASPILPPRTFSFCSSAEAAKALKSNWPTSRSKRTRMVVSPGGPGRQQARLDEGEGLLAVCVARLIDGRALHAHSAFHGQVIAQPPCASAEHLASGLLDLDRGGGQGNEDAAIAEGLVGFQHVVGDLAAGLPRQIRRLLEADQCAQDGF